MLVTVDGIIVGKRDIGDSSCFLDILTDEYGIIEVIAHGIKKLKSKNAASTAMFSYSTFCLNKSHFKYTINSSVPKYSFHKLSSDIILLSLAAYFSELIKYTSATEQKSNAAESELRLFAITLFELSEHKRPEKLIKAAFELKLCALLGLMPDFVACADCFCYESETFYFLLEDGIIICDDCFSDKYNIDSAHVFCLSPELLHLMRHIVYSPADRMYKCTAEIKSLNEINIIAEKYLLYHLGRGFKTLDYYKNLTR